ISVFGCALIGAACGGEAAGETGEIASTEQALTELEGRTDDPNCKWMYYGNKEIWGCDYKLPVGPSGSSNWGICGITAVGSKTDPNTLVRILADADGYYHLLVGVGDPADADVYARAACARMTAFSGLPPASQAKATVHYSVSSEDAPEPGETVV